jgi:DNA-binding transcriptional regulator YiaG
MTHSLNPSEVARLREQIALQEEAARLALYGYAEVSRHERITARLEQETERILRLIEAGRQDEALDLLNKENWGVVDMEAGRRGYAEL